MRGYPLFFLLVPSTGYRPGVENKFLNNGVIRESFIKMLQKNSENEKKYLYNLC